MVDPMLRYVEAAARHPNMRVLEQVLDLVIPRPVLHARFVNTLSRLEYVGVRKMLKGRRADGLDLDGLEHVLEEAVHALRLKKAAMALAPHADDVRTFAAAHTLAGDAGERYFQALDRGAEAALAQGEEGTRAEANYLITSAAIEVRAQVFYPLYEQRLRAYGAPFSVASITRDESRHLSNMAARLDRLLPGWPVYLEPILRAEEDLFGGFLAAVQHAASMTSPPVI
jgi:hypothetical protein